MDPELTRALAPVLADLRATDGPVPRIEDADWTGSADRASAMAWSPGGSGRGVAVTRGQPLADQVTEVADGLQEWAVEELARAGRSNWPPCPRHPATHPLEARLTDAAAWWVCPRDGARVSEIGTLG